MRARGRAGGPTVETPELPRPKVSHAARVRRPRLASVLSYYWPYVSGLSEMARRLNEGLVAAGWDVHVVTTRYERSLAPHANVNGVSVTRCSSVARLGRAAVSPSFPLSAIRAARNADVVMMHLPLPEAAVISYGSIGRPAAVLYHCDAAKLLVPFEGVFHAALDWSSRVALRRSAVNLGTSIDYAENSRMRSVLTERFGTLPPPCVPPGPGQPTFRETSGTHFGFLGRIVPEKGLQYLVSAFRRLDDPSARLLIAGEFDEVAGSAAIRTVSAAAQGDPRVRLLGFVTPEAVPDFYASLDAFVLPSVDSFEAFGIVQVEALMAGIPVIASDLPGVRTVLQDTGAGIIVAPRDVDGLTTALTDITKMHFDPDVLRRDSLARYGEAAAIQKLDTTLRSLLPASR